MNDLTTFTGLIPLDNGLCVVSTIRSDGSVQASVVNAGVIDHPVTAEEVVAFVAAGPAKLRNLHSDPRCTIVVRAGWRWVAVEGSAELVGPDDPHHSIDAERLRLLLREIFKAAGGRHDDWDEYDRAMADESRVAVLVSPLRIYSNPTT